MKKNKENLLRDYLREVFFEAKIGASKDYMKKELIREELQNIIVEKIKSGSIKSQEDLNEIWNSYDMSIKTLKMIPIDIWKKM